MKNNTTFYVMVIALLHLSVLTVFGLADDGKNLSLILEQWSNYYQNNMIGSTLLAVPPDWKMQDKSHPMYHYSSKFINSGPIALPVLIEFLTKNHYDFDEEFKSVFISQVIRRIAKFKFDHYCEIMLDEYQGLFLYKFFILWFNDAWKYAPRKFETLYTELIKLKKLNCFNEAQKKYQSITDFGIILLPLMIEKLKSGDIDFIPAISTLTDGKVKENSTVENCLSWWEEHKNEYLVFPGQEKLRK